MFIYLAQMALLDIIRPAPATVTYRPACLMDMTGFSELRADIKLFSISRRGSTKIFRLEKIVYIRMLYWTLAIIINILIT